MVLEFHYMEIQLEHGGSVEKLLDSLGRRSGIEDIQNFSQILIQSKKMGGNMRRILQECITSMEEQRDVKKEIQAMLASRRLEQRIMSILPFRDHLIHADFFPFFFICALRKSCRYRRHDPVSWHLYLCLPVGRKAGGN